MDMHSRIDPLIAERAQWLTREDPLVAGVARPLLNRLLGQARTVALADSLSAHPAATVMDRAARLIARRVEASGLSHLPASGPAIVVANHPTGIADGLVLWRLLTRRRPDAFFFANADVLRVLPQLDEVIAPVEWRPERKSHGRTRETLAFARRAFAREARLGVIFPSGRLAQRRGLHLHERPWMTSAAALARKYRLPVLPIHIHARNSALYYLFDAIHPSLRDITLFHETLNKTAQPYRVTIGAPLLPEDLPADPAEATARLRAATLCLGPQPRAFDGPFRAVGDRRETLRFRNPRRA